MSENGRYVGSGRPLIRRIGSSTRHDSANRLSRLCYSPRTKSLTLQDASKQNDGAPDAGNHAEEAMMKMLKRFVPALVMASVFVVTATVFALDNDPRPPGVPDPPVRPRLCYYIEAAAPAWVSHMLCG